MQDEGVHELDHYSDQFVTKADREFGLLDGLEIQRGTWVKIFEKKKMRTYN
jgi:hypothetical protein